MHERLTYIRTHWFRNLISGHILFLIISYGRLFHSGGNLEKTTHSVNSWELLHACTLVLLWMYFFESIFREWNIYLYWEITVWAFGDGSETLNFLVTVWYLFWFTTTQCMFQHHVSTTKHLGKNIGSKFINWVFKRFWSWGIDSLIDFNFRTQLWLPASNLRAQTEAAQE